MTGELIVTLIVSAGIFRQNRDGSLDERSSVSCMCYRKKQLTAYFTALFQWQQRVNPMQSNIELNECQTVIRYFSMWTGGF